MLVLNFDVGRDVGSEHHLDQKDQNGDVFFSREIIGKWFQGNLLLRRQKK